MTLCKAKKADGNRCSRDAYTKTNFCKQHKNYGRSGGNLKMEKRKNNQKIPSKDIMMIPLISLLIIAILVLLYSGLSPYFSTEKQTIHPLNGGVYYLCSIYPDCTVNGESYTCFEGKFSYCESIKEESLNVKINSLPLVIEGKGKIGFKHLKGEDYESLLNQPVSVKCQSDEFPNNEYIHGGFVVEDNIILCRAQFAQ